MQSFDDYVARQAAQSEVNARVAEDLRKQDEIKAENARRIALERFRDDVVGPLASAARSLSRHVPATSEASGIAAHLTVGAIGVPRRVTLTVSLSNGGYKLSTVSGHYDKSAETETDQASIGPALDRAIRDVADRWFQTNAYQR